jgi:uncharacterized protein (DUF58 family)
MRYPQEGMSKLEYGAYLAAALQYLMIGQRDAAGMTLFDDDIRFFAPAKSRYSWLVPIFKELEQVVNRKDSLTHTTATAKVLHQIAMKFHRRSFVVLITDLFNQAESEETLIKALRHLRHEKHEVIVFHLLDKETEEKFAFPNRPMIFKDLESGEKIEVLPHQIRDAYQQQMTAYKQRFKQRCYEFKIDFIEVDIKQPYDKVLTDYLVKRRSLS